MIKLPEEWEQILNDTSEEESPWNKTCFYKELRLFLKQFDMIIPQKKEIFNVFYQIPPSKVKVVLFGEDPYPRLTSACGVAFWDKEITSWEVKTKGSSLKNILKGLIILKGWGTSINTIEECRTIAIQKKMKSPPELFEFWLKKGILLINTALTYSSIEEKKRHFDFWRNFNTRIINTLNKRGQSPYYVLWGGKARKWLQVISRTIDDRDKIICQGHPTFMHQFFNKNNIHYTPFTELIEKTKIKWY